MVRSRLQSRIATGKMTLPVTIVLTVVLWGLLFSWKPSVSMEIPDYPLLAPVTKWLSESLAGRWLALGCHGLIGYLLIESNNAYAVIRARTSLQTSVYYWFLLAAPFLFAPSLAVGSFVSLCLGIAVYFLFRTYQRTQPVNHVFYAMFFVGLSSLLFPRILFLYPVLLLGLYQFKALTLRTFFAGIAGISVPYWFLFGHAFFYGEMPLFYLPFQELSACFVVSRFPQMPVSLLLSLSVVALVLLVGGVHYKLTSHEDKIRTRSYLDFLILVGLAVVVLGIWQPAYILVWLQVLLPIASLLGGHLFVLSRTKLANLFFVFFLLLSGAVMVYNLWRC